MNSGLASRGSHSSQDPMEDFLSREKEALQALQLSDAEEKIEEIDNVNSPPSPQEARQTSRHQSKGSFSENPNFTYSMDSNSPRSPSSNSRKNTNTSFDAVAQVPTTKSSNPNQSQPEGIKTFVKRDYKENEIMKEWHQNNLQAIAHAEEQADYEFEEKIEGMSSKLEQMQKDRLEQIAQNKREAEEADEEARNNSHQDFQVIKGTATKDEVDWSQVKDLLEQLPKTALKNAPTKLVNIVNKLAAEKQ